MKKTLLSLGTLVSTIAPVASVIACGDGDVPGHEAPYSISIKANEHIPTQANVEVTLKGYISESYLREIKSRIAESIAELNKDELKYTTFSFAIGKRYTSTYTSFALPAKLADATPLTETNKNDLDAIHNLIDSKFDEEANYVKTLDGEKMFFDKKYWDVVKYNKIGKEKLDELKGKILKLFNFNSTNIDLINVEYNAITDKYIDFVIERTDVAANPELSTADLRFNTSDLIFEKGEAINLMAYFEDNSFSTDDLYIQMGNSKTRLKNGTGSYSGIAFNSINQMYKLTKLLLKENGFTDSLKFEYPYYSATPNAETFGIPSGSSITRAFGFDDRGSSQGVKFSNLNNTYKIDFDKRTFKINADITNSSSKQWVFGKDGNNLTIEPNQKWSMEFQGTYELNTAGNALETITSLTKAIATHGSNSVNIFDASAKEIVKHICNDIKLFLIN